MVNPKLILFEHKNMITQRDKNNAECLLDAVESPCHFYVDILKVCLNELPHVVKLELSRHPIVNRNEA